MRGWLLLWVMTGTAAQVFATDDVDYERDIKPLFAQKCGVCHGALKQQAGLRLDAGVLIRKGSENGPVVVPGKAASSLLFRKVIAKDIDERMPPEGEGEPLNARQLALFAAWINAGAVVPKDEVIPTDPRKHWAYLVPKRPPLPHGDNPRWSHPIDAFIAREHQRLGLKAVEPAGRPPYALAPRFSEPDRPTAVPTAVAGFPSRPIAKCLAQSAGFAAGQSTLRRTLGATLDGRLALQRLGRIQATTPRQPAAHLAVARLDRPIVERR